MKLIFPVWAVSIVCAALRFAQNKMTDKIKISRIEREFSISELEDEAWEQAKEITVEKYWSGEKAPEGRHFKAKLLWSNAALYVRFEANQTEPLIVGDAPDLKTKTIGLWDRDVCEIFVAPDGEKPNEYYEFEIAPTGEWIDLKIRRLARRRETDFDYRSGMQSAARIETNKITTAMKIGWKAFGKTPRADEVWRGNLFRCVGFGETRGYLAWSPTRTATPNFHVPERFGEFRFAVAD